MERIPNPLAASADENANNVFKIPDLTPKEARAVGDKILRSIEQSEREGQFGEQSKQPEQIDDFANLAQRVSETSTEAYEVLNATNPAARAEFMEQPDLRVPHNVRGKLNRDEIADKLSRIQELEEELADGDYSDKQKRILESTLAANRLENSFVMANILYNENPTEKNAAIHRLANEALYGRPDRNTFLALLNERLEKIEHKSKEGKFSPEEEQEYRELKELLGPVESSVTERYRPRQETVERFADMVEVFFAPIFKHIPDNKDEFSVNEAAEIADEALRDVVPEDSEWHAEVEPGRRAAAVSQENKKIFFPEDRVYGKTYSRQALKKILAHELGVHAMRAIPFEKHDIGSFRTGLTDYENFEEGVAKAMEQALDRKFDDQVGTRHYISIGLVNFMDKDFRDVYEIQKRISRLTKGKNNDNIMYNSVQRALRGTDVLPNNKDLVYYNGNEKVWKFIEQNIDDPELFDKLFLNGKTDITNPDHERAAYEAKVAGFSKRY